MSTEKYTKAKKKGGEREGEQIVGREKVENAYIPFMMFI